MKNPVLQSSWMLITAAFFTLLAVCMKIAADTYSIYEIIFYRSIFGIGLTYAVVRKQGISLKPRYPWGYLFRCAMGTTCITLGVYIVWVLPLATAQTLNYTAPLFFALISILEAKWLGQKISWALIGALITGFAGVLLILRPSVDPALLVPMVIGLAVGLTGGIADFTVRKLAVLGEPAPRIVFYFILAGILVGFTGTIITEGFHAIDLHGFIVLGLIGLFGTLGQLTMTQAWKFGDPLLNTVYQYAGVVFAVAIGYVIFNDKLDLLTLVGIAVVCLSGAAASIISFRSRRKSA